MAGPWEEYQQAGPWNDYGSTDNVRNPVMDKRKESEAIAQGQAYTERSNHLERMKSDPFYATAQNQNLGQNVLASMGGVLKGLGYVGPRQLLGKTKPGEYEAWKKSMEALNTTAGGKIGSMAGYAVPIVAATPVTGVSVPLNALVGGAEAFIDPADSAEQRGWKTAIGAGLSGVGQKVGNLVGNAATNARASRQLMSAPGSATVRENVLTNTLGKGYKLPPSAAGKPSLLEGVSGQIKTQQAMSDFNQSLTDSFVRKELGNAAKFGYRVTPNTPLTSETMKQVRAAAGRPYQQIKELGDLPVGEGKTINAAIAVEQLKQLRFDGHQQLSAARASGNPEALAQSRKMLDDAAKLEKLLEEGLERAGKKELLQDLKDARALIAKSYNIQDAIRESVGSVDARELGALYEIGEKGFGPKLTGELADIGKAGSAFKESMALRGFNTPRYSALDFAVGGLNAGNAAASGNLAGMLAGGIPLLRGPARDKLMSDSVQKKLMKKTTPPNAFMKAAPWLFDYTPNLGLLGPVPLSRSLYPSLLNAGLLTEEEYKPLEINVIGGTAR